MPRPHPALIELAAGRPMPRTVPDPDHLVTSAVEHRMHGLLWSAVMRGDIEISLDLERTLARLDLLTQAEHHKQWATLEEVTERLGERGIEVAAFKGVTTETRWYDRRGERPSRDLDLWINPDHFDRIDEVVDLLHPGHPLKGDVGNLARNKHFQSVDLDVDGVDVDFHFDPLKLGVWVEDLPGLWKHTKLMDGYRTLNDELALVQLLLHLNKDRFSWLLGLADVARMRSSWDLACDLADKIGASIPVRASLATVGNLLKMGESDLTKPPALWGALWPERVQLNGDAGWAHAHRRQFLLPLFLRGPWSARVRFYWGTVFPPRPLIDYWYGDVPGGAVGRLTRGRFRRARERAHFRA